MADTIQCDTHGESNKAYLCHHLTGKTVFLGFNRNDPTEDNPFPDAWCDDCEIIREAHGAWNEISEKLTKIVLVCAECYKQIRIRNTKTESTLDALDDVRWQCGSCDKWHTGPILDIAFDHPDYWSAEHAGAFAREQKAGAPARNLDGHFLDADFCAADGKVYFARGYIELPIIGTEKTFSWGVWGSLSRDSMEKTLAYENDPENAPLPPPLFSWLNNTIRFYPAAKDGVKMWAHIQPGLRPRFEVQPSDHPLAIDANEGIEPSRVLAIMQWRLPELRQ